MTSVEPSVFSLFHFACFTNAYICCLLTFPFMVTEGNRTVRANASIPSSLPPFFVIWTWTRHRSSISSEQRGLRAAEVFTVMDQPDPHLYPRGGRGGARTRRLRCDWRSRGANARGGKSAGKPSGAARTASRCNNGTSGAAERNFVWT